MMTLLNIKIDMAEITEYPPEEIVENLEKLLEPYHLKWVMTNCYRVEAGFDEDEMVQGAIKALKEAAWLTGALQIGVEKELIRYLLQAIDAKGMSTPAQSKMEHYREYFAHEILSEEELNAHNPIVLDQNKKVINGYVTYLIMKEQGYEFATCLQKTDFLHFFH